MPQRQRSEFGGGKSEGKDRWWLGQAEPFSEQPTWVRSQIAGEAARLAEFLGGNLELEWTTVK